MNSRESIKEELQLIAKNHELKGESVDLQVDLLSYCLFHEQLEISNTARELSISSAVLINSKIELGMDRMYSVYRGNNPIVTLNMLSNSFIKADKLGLLYESSSFYVYAADPLNLTPTVGDSDGVRHPIQVQGILCKSEKIVASATVDKSNKYYIDLKIDGHLCNNLSEDIVVKIGIEGDMKEYKTTRFFPDHAKSVEPDELIFVLTIPDFGIRLFKKGFFNVDDTVVAEVLTYTEFDELNQDELDKILIPGTELVEGEAYPSGRSFLDNVPRENAKSLQYNSNFAGRVNHEIQSCSDVNYLFQEINIAKVLNSSYIYNDDTNSIDIYYIPKLPSNPLTALEISNFIKNYKSYFITMDMVISLGTKYIVPIFIDVVMNDSMSLLEPVQEILSDYEYQLGMELNENLIRSRVSKLDSVKYVNKIEIQTPTTESGGAIDPELISGPNIYYEFNVTVNYIKQ